MLLLLDQRALPDAERWIRCETVDDVARLHPDARRARRARNRARSRVRHGARRRPRGRGRRAAALDAADRGEPRLGARAVPRGHATCWRWRAGCTASRTRRTGGWPGLGAELFESGTRALTHCNAGALATGGYGTAGGVLRAAWESGRLAEVWVDETRPLLQGARLTAWELRQAGIPHRVVADSAAGSLMARGLVDRVVVGADRVAANGDVANKVGTYPLAVLAQRHDVPFYVAAPLSTIDPATPNGAAIPIEERDPGEVLAGGEAFNPAFDVTPAELVTAIVTEAGVLEAPYSESIARALGAGT